jgi:hypothetical protein
MDDYDGYIKHAKLYTNVHAMPKKKLITQKPSFASVNISTPTRGS